MLSFAKEPWEETVTPEEYDEVVAGDKFTAYIGVEPSFSEFHIGNLKSFLPLIYLKQKFPDKANITFLLADLHAMLNKKGALGEIQRWTSDLTYATKRHFSRVIPDVRIVVGTDFQDVEKNPAYWRDAIKSLSIVPLKDLQDAATGTMSEEASQSGASIFYPLLQALDMKALGVDIALGGNDQRATHLRVARELLPKIGYRKPVCLHGELVESLESQPLLEPLPYASADTYRQETRGIKMSKSRPEYAVFLTDDDEIIREKVSGAYCPLGTQRPNSVKHLVRYFISYFQPEVDVRMSRQYGGGMISVTPEEAIKMYEQGKIHPQDFKEMTADNLITILKEFR